MSRTTLSIVAVAWFLAASYVQAGPIAADNAATSSELASLGGLLQALGAGVIGNGALLYPTAASSHQRAESEILASDTVTRVYKKVKSALKDGGLGDDDDGGDDSSKSITYLVKPALIFHKEELPPPNPLAGNVLPLPGGALLYTPTPTANGGAAEPTNGPAASIKAAYGNLFAASPYTPSYTLNKPHAAVIVEEVTDMISLKSVQQREEDAGEDVADDDSDEEDEYGRKRRKKAVKIISLETIDSTSTFINPFTRADFPFGLITPTAAAPAPGKEGTEESISKKSQKKTIKKTVSAKSTSTVAPASSSSQQLNASMGKDGGITVVNNGASASSQGTTIVIPAASLQSSTSGASAASSSSASASAASSSGSSASPASTSESAHEESSKNDDHSANEVSRFARTHKTSAKPDMAEPTKAGGQRRDAVVSSNDPLAAGTMDTQVASSLSSLAQGENKETASPSVTLGSAISPEQHPETAVNSASSDMPKRRKMHIVRVYEVKKNKHSGTVETMTVATSTSAEVMHKRDMMPVYEAQPTNVPLVDVAASSTSMMADGYPYPDIHVGYVQRMQREDDEDSDAEDASDAIELSDADNVSDALEQSDAEEASVDRKAESKSAESSSASASAASSSASASAESTSASASAASSSASASAESTSAASSAKDATVASSTTAPAASSSASAESTAAEAQSTSLSAHNTSAKSLSIETVDAPATSGTSAASTTVDSEKSESSDSDSDSDSESDNESDVKRNQDSDSDSDNESDAKKDSGSDSESDSEEKSKKRPADDSDSDDEKNEKAPRRRHAISVVDADEDPFKAIQRIAAAGMREAEKAAIDYELHSDSDGIELLTTEDAVKHTSSLATNAEPTKVRAADDKDSDNDSDKEADNEKDSESDSDSDDNKSADKDSDSDSDSDSDDESSKSPRKPKTTGPAERMSTRQAPDVAGEDEKEEMAARKALSEALAESAKQAVSESATELEDIASESADSDYSEAIRDAAEATNATDVIGHDRNADDDDYEYETNSGVNSDGDEVEFVTQLVADDVTKKAKVAESPSIVVMASIDEEYEEEYFTGTSTVPAASASGEAGHVQRNAVDAQEDDVEEDKVIPGIEPTPDVGLIKESQNRAINIGLGNLRRHI
ncbi:hypothetical protein LPJ53_002113 [Coemansia erecta]|uniref:Uncharacterized protein n=1 Tax=Coemansia erecta TaxID=147472 RepID=A0A9W7Y3Z3_9FUNG|nr:hypothetical protein LPJ53_002113 [Coemansia erecta]